MIGKMSCGYKVYAIAADLLAMEVVLIAIAVGLAAGATFVAGNNRGE